MTPLNPISQLKSEGYQKVYTWDAKPNESDSNHTHPHDTALIVLEGEIAITIGGKSHLLKPGDRFNIPKETLHSGFCGPDGCKYVVGEGK